MHRENMLRSIINEIKIPRKDRLVRDRAVRTVLWKRYDLSWA